MNDEAVRAIRGGEAVIIPTDTVYGLVVDARRETAVETLSLLKGRPETMPCALMAAELDALLAALPELAGAGGAVTRALLPGPYTLVVPNPARRFPWLCGARPDAIGVRVPVLPEPGRAVVDAVGVVASTSANLHGGPDPARLDDVPARLRAAVGAVVDGGELPGRSSTVVDVTGSEPRVLREGAVPAADVLARLRSLR